jgi:hypothetical protein
MADDGFHLGIAQCRQSHCPHSRHPEAAMDVRFNLVAPEQVLGALKATGSTDRDVLFAAKEEFAARYRPLRWFGIWALVTGALSTLLVVFAFIGIPLMILGWWWLRRARRNLATIEATYASFTGEGIKAVPASGASARIAVSVLLAALLSAAPGWAQDAVPAEQAGDWVPATAGCTSPLKLVLAGTQSTLVNGADRLTTGNVGVTYSYFGASYQGISFVLMPDYDKTQPYIVYFNTNEKKGQTTVEFNDASLRKRFPLEKTVLKRCPTAAGGAAAAPASKQARAAAPADPCGGAARCVGTRAFTASLADLRLSRYGNDKVLTFSVRIRNLLEQPLYLGLVQGSGLVIDDQGMRYTLAGGSNAVRGMGLVNDRTFDPKFVLQPGESGDVRVELMSRAQQGQIFGTVYDLDFALREIEALPGNSSVWARNTRCSTAGSCPTRAALHPPRPRPPSSAPRRPPPPRPPRPRATWTPAPARQAASGRAPSS